MAAAFTAEASFGQAQKVINTSLLPHLSDQAVLKLRKRVAQYYGATVGNLVLLEEAAAVAAA